MKQSEDLDNVEVFHTIGPNATVLDKIEAIFNKAMDVYNYFCAAQVWIKQTHGVGNMLNFIAQKENVCWNLDQIVIAWNNARKVAVHVISLLKAKEVRFLAFALHAFSHDGAPADVGQVLPHHPIQGNPTTP